MGVHRVCVFGEALSEGDLRLVGVEAKHALQVKRVVTGERIEVVNGAGQVGRGVVMSGAKRELVVRIEEVGEVARVSPAVEVCSASPKGNRMERMIDALVQVGCARWSAMETKLGVVEPGAGKMNRMDRVGTEALKQSGRAWAMEIGKRVRFADAVRAAEGIRVVLADAGGERYRASGGSGVRVLIGPEGGWTDQERSQALEAGAERVRFGPEVMRIEVAAAAAVGIVLAMEMSRTTQSDG